MRSLKKMFLVEELSLKKQCCAKSLIKEAYYEINQVKGFFYLCSLKSDLERSKSL